MRLIAYRIPGQHPNPIRPADLHRPWIDQTPGRFARRCLPLLAANQAGWTIHLPSTVTATWAGGEPPGAISVTGPATSHFGSGILTFHVPYLFRTPAGWDLWARGPANDPRDGATALEGIIETDWASMPFTMNWKLTRPGSIVFPAGSAYCHILPVPKTMLDRAEPELRDLHDDPATLARYETWARSRGAFITSPERGDGWQKHYHQGRHATGEPADGEHRTRRHLKPFRAV